MHKCLLMLTLMHSFTHALALGSWTYGRLEVCSTELVNGEEVTTCQDFSGKGPEVSVESVYIHKYMHYLVYRFHHHHHHHHN